MEERHWRAIPEGVAAVLRGRPLAAADAFAVSTLGAAVHAPRAMNVRHHHNLGRAPPGSLAAEIAYRAQEKMDGVYVLWTGRRLLTKAGTLVDQRRFVRALPPAVALVGELYTGTLTGATALVRDVTNPDWVRARFIAFDMPGLDAEWPYAVRYALLCHVVAAWNHRRRGSESGSGIKRWLPLQVVRQHGMDRLAELFLAVVHGQTWEERRRRGLLPFGCPVGVAARAPVDYVVAQTEGPWIGDDDADGCPWEEPDVGAGGEGLMLWHQGRPWSERGRTGRTTDSILKYKPTVLTVAVPYRAPYHAAARRTTSEIVDPEDVAGYHVRLRWRDPIHGHDTRIVGFIGPNVAPEELDRRFPVEAPVFATFVAFGAKPHYVHAMGADRLTHWDAQRVHAHARLLARSEQPNNATLVPALDDVANPRRWRLGDMRALFPWDVAWSPHWMCRAAVVRRTLTPCPEMWEDLTLRHDGKRVRAPPAGGDSTKRPAAAAAAQQQQREGDLARALRRDAATWVRGNQPRVAPFLVGCVFVVARWASRQVAAAPASALWFTGRVDEATAPLAGGLLREWGPFRVAEAATAEERWAECWLRILVTLVAAAWLRLGGMLPDTDDGLEARLPALVGEAEALLAEAATVRYAPVRALVLPPTTDVGFMPGRGPSGPPFLHLGAVARYAQHAVGGSWLATEPPWAPYMTTGRTAAAMEVALVPRDLVTMATSMGAGPTTGGDAAVAGVWNRVVREWIATERWTPRPDAVTLERATMLPRKEGEELVMAVAAVTMAPPSAVRTACEAAMRAMAGYY